MPTDPMRDTAITDTENSATPAESALSAGVKPRVVENCGYCKLYGDSVMMPPHFASDACKSGGHNHCTCGICF